MEPLDATCDVLQSAAQKNGSATSGDAFSRARACQPRANRNTFAHISHLPTEMLLRIFSLARERRGDIQTLVRITHDPAAIGRHSSRPHGRCRRVPRMLRGESTARRLSLPRRPRLSGPAGIRSLRAHGPRPGHALCQPPGCGGNSGGLFRRLGPQALMLEERVIEGILGDRERGPADYASRVVAQALHSERAVLSSPSGPERLDDTRHRNRALSSMQSFTTFLRQRPSLEILWLTTRLVWDLTCPGGTACVLIRHSRD
ncbi:hypothetical protein C8Q77DRAFT_564407 [Trametes polyzona]|nr:hypothetical protein C8Q77DRAFT_564407 [Trametes polyzona]